MERTKFSDNTPRRQTKHYTQYNPAMLHMVTCLALKGCTDTDIANALNIGHATIDLWKRTRPEFLEALTRGKEQADAKVAESLYKVAIGFDYPMQVIKEYHGKYEVIDIMIHKPPNAWAAAKWLSMRDPVRWRETHDVNINTSTTSTLRVDLRGITTEELMLLKKIGMHQITEGEGHVVDD
jgi:hypothetical protein